MRKANLLFYLILFLSLVSCSPTSNLDGVPQDTPAISGYPEPLDPSEDTSYPGPAYLTPVNPDVKSFSDTLEIPEPADGKGIVYGQFVVNNGAGNAYLLGEIYLAPVIYSEGEIQFPFISLDVDNDLTAEYRTSDHQFLFVDVLPGTYGIVIHTPVNDYVVPDDAEGFFYVDVEKGDIIDLGIITIE